MEKVFSQIPEQKLLKGRSKLPVNIILIKLEVPKGEIIAMEHSFHGRSMGPWQSWLTQISGGFWCMMPNIKFAQFNNLASCKNRSMKKPVRF